jgi:hypothetical protein
MHESSGQFLSQKNRFLIHFNDELHRRSSYAEYSECNAINPTRFLNNPPNVLMAQARKQRISVPTKGTRSSGPNNDLNGPHTREPAARAMIAPDIRPKEVRLST